VKRPTNLREFRKRRARDEKSRAAAARRAHDGETKASRTARALNEAQRRRILDGADGFE
jgi:hypothetical protein